LDDRVFWALAGLIGAAILADIVLNSGTAFLFLARKVLDLVQALVFWRH
jgi:hypothetical protein